jgi:diketogulonate reductase-like aldo/keto reductase
MCQEPTRSKKQETMSHNSKENTSSSNNKKPVIPSIGFGTFNSFQDNDKVYESVKFAIKAGYRLIDCAPLYGNEKEVGQAVRECIQEGIVDRQDLFIMSKLWNTEHDPQDVDPACRETLNSLGLEYLDLYMMHWPVQMTKDSKLVSTRDGGEFKFEIVHSGDRDKLAQTYQAMENLVQKGLVKNLGVSNFSTRQLSELLIDCEIKPIANEVEIHPFLQQSRLFHYCEERDIQVIQSFR